MHAGWSRLGRLAFGAGLTALAVFAAFAPVQPAYAAHGGGFGGYGNGPITPVSAQTRSVPHPPADSPVRAGSIREDVARYNEERGAFRPVQQRSGGEAPRPPMPSPYRN
ncbi:MAG: hypothetical protein EPN70_17230 [Paraburkholderia sp.]|nr:MAG: hypothetical protein EPN70_17230 [Paraburkholderia sp.]TAM30581.1 MAG: hypothetical protein EPN59_08885 [Paraburkholderia sp.]